MKKILAWMLCVVMLASLAACGDTAPDNNSTSQSGTGGSAGTPAGTDATQKPTETNATQKPAENDATQKPAETDATPEPAGTDGGNSDASTGEDGINNFISSKTLIKVPDLSFTLWDFSGGYENGKELTASEASDIKVQNNYVFLFNFPDSSTATVLERNGNSLYGNYTIQEDGYTLKITLDDNGTQTSYTTKFTNIDNMPVMMYFLDGSAETVWYFTLFTDVG